MFLLRKLLNYLRCETSFKLIGIFVVILEVIYISVYVLYICLLLILLCLLIFCKSIPVNLLYQRCITGLYNLTFYHNVCMINR